MSVAEAALQRLSSRAVKFPGASYAEQLVNGRNAAHAALLKYVPDLKYDVNKAKAALTSVKVWVDTHPVEIEAALKENQQVPDAIKLTMGVDKAASYIVALFTQAAVGLGPWQSGLVDSAAATGKLIGTSWAREDAENRLLVFGSIVALEQDGHLKDFFQGGVLAGLGSPAVLIALFVAITAVAVAVVVFSVVWNEIAKRNNELMGELCREAQKNGNELQVAQCINATKDLQTAGGVFGLDVNKLILIGGLIVSAVVFGPSLYKRLKKDRA